MNPYKKLPPFKWFVLQNFPFIEEDFDAITEYQLLCKIVEYLNRTIDKTNELGEQVEALNNWFINLDVQDEIDNKLNDMAESGELAEIINQEIFDELNTQVTANTNAIEEIQRRKFLLVGDSYLQGYSPDMTYTSWGEYFETVTGFDCDVVANGGASFSNYSNSFYALIDAVTDTDYTDVVILGGYNDIGGSFSNIVTGIHNTADLIKTKFTSLKNIYIGMCSNTLDYEQTNHLYNVLRAYNHGAKENNCHYLNGIENSLCLSTYFSSDGIHPNQNGQYAIALNLTNCINTGYSNNIVQYSEIEITFDSDYTGDMSTFGAYINNNVLYLTLQAVNMIACNDVELTCNMQDSLKLGTLTTTLAIKGNYTNMLINVPCVIKNDGDYYDVAGQILIKDGDVYFKAMKINDANSSYQTYSKIEQIQLSPFSACFISNTI